MKILSMCPSTDFKWKSKFYLVILARYPYLNFSSFWCLSDVCDVTANKKARVTRNFEWNQSDLSTEKDLKKWRYKWIEAWIIPGELDIFGTIFCFLFFNLSVYVMIKGVTPWKIFQRSIYVGSVFCVFHCWDNWTNTTIFEVEERHSVSTSE